MIEGGRANAHHMLAVPSQATNSSPTGQVLSQIPLQEVREDDASPATTFRTGNHQKGFAVERALSGDDGPAVRWADLDDRESCHRSDLHYDGTDEEQLLLVGKLLGISSTQRSMQLKEVLKEFWEAERREQEEEQQVRRTKKRERELRNLQSSVNYHRSLVLVDSVREVVVSK